jgi:hypothetical protein
VAPVDSTGTCRKHRHDHSVREPARRVRRLGSATTRSVGNGGRKLRTESSVASPEDSHGEKNLPATRTAGYRDGMKHFKFNLRDLFWLVLVTCSLGRN